MKPNAPRKQNRPNAAPEPTGLGPESSPASRPGIGRRWVFRIAAFGLVPFFLLGGLELALRIAGYGYPTHLFLPRVINRGKVLIENQAFGWRFFPPVAARTPRPMAISAEKPPHTYRIFVLGESAAFGDPEPSFGFTRILEVLLQSRYPGRQFEVVNAAMTAINSNVILPIARDCARQSADLWVIYMGNNEVVGPFGAGTVFGPQAPSLGFIRASIAFQATKIGQLFARLRPRWADRKGAPRSWGGMEMFVEHQRRQDDPRMTTVYAQFERNLADILRVGARSGARIILSTVASNIKDCAPFASLHRVGLTAAQRAEWDQAYRTGIDAQKEGKLSAAMEAYRRAAQLDDHYADLQFRWGQCCSSLGQLEEARQHFVLARDGDGLRFRADSRINVIIRQAADRQNGQGIQFLDADAILAGKSPQGILGSEFFYEHVHLNYEGNYWLARIVADQTAKILTGATVGKAEPQSTWLSAEECAQRLALTDWNRCEIAELIRQRLELAPFPQQLNHREQHDRLTKQIEQLRESLTPLALMDAVQTYRRAVAQRPNDWVLAENLGRLLQKTGDLTGAAAQWRKVAEILPHYPEAYYHSGTVLDQQGRSDEAIVCYRQALRVKPDFPEALNGWGLALANQGQFTEAIVQYEKALRLKPDFAGTHVNLGLALSRLGKMEEAKAQYVKALQLKPDSAGAYINLGKILNSQGRISEAITNYTEALRLNPDDAVAHFNLGNTLRTLGRVGEAQEHYAAAVRINPAFAEARCQLGFELARQGKETEAMAQFSEAVRLKPDYAEAHLNLGVALAKQQRINEALQHFQEALRIDPAYVTAKKYLEAAQALQRKGP